MTPESAQRGGGGGGTTGGLVRADTASRACACCCWHCPRLEDGWDAEPESATAGDTQALRDQVAALEAALVAKDAALAAALGTVAFLEAKIQALGDGQGSEEEFEGFGV